MLNREEVTNHVESTSKKDDRGLYEVSHGAGMLKGFKSHELLINFICFIEGMDKSQYLEVPPLFAKA